MLRVGGGIELAMVRHQEGGPMARKVTLLELVNAVSEHAQSEDETIATIIYMVNRGVVRLCGTFKGARFDLRTLAAA